MSSPHAHFLVEMSLLELIKEKNNNGQKKKYENIIKQEGSNG